MDTHSTSVAEAEHAVVVPATGERFEKSELEYFVDEDKTAGQAIGKLLAVVFMISLFLVGGVCIWILNVPAPTDDPQAGIGIMADDAEHH